ncbi:MAG TPA: hypothetical protein VFS12_10225 [Terriglobia bacterium]|nr:hypothetical protein [Terriglobia bacterium]
MRSAVAKTCNRSFRPNFGDTQHETVESRHLAQQGSLSAVVYTDAFQTVVFLASSAFLTVVALSTAGGWSGVASRVPDGFLHMAKPVTDPDYPITGLIFGNYSGGMFYWCMDQVIVQRVLGAGSIEEGKKGATFAGFLKILPVFIFVLPGAIAAAPPSRMMPPIQPW